MSYDKNGNWDYEAEAMEEQLRGRSDTGRAMAESAQRFGMVFLAIVAFCALVAISWGGYYVAGRVVGAGVADGIRGTK